jgi:hypothetical protein
MHTGEFEYQVAFFKNSEELRFVTPENSPADILMMLLVGTKR